MKVTVLFPLNTTETDQDKLVSGIERALRNGYETDHVGFGDSASFVTWMMENRPEFVVNLYDQQGKLAKADISAVGVLDFLEIPHTGGGPVELAIQSDKAVMKKLLTAEGIKTPDWALFPPEGQMEMKGQPTLPVFIKPVSTDSSIGIDDKSYCETEDEMLSKIKSIHSELGVAALVESYIEGREMHAAVIGNEKPHAFPVVETVFENVGGGANVLTAKEKFSKKGNADSQVAEISTDLTKRIQRIAEASYLALDVVDYGRLDIRLDAQENIWVIEVNASPTLLDGDAFAMAARADGMDYNALVGKIMALAKKRYAGQKRTGPRSSPGSPPAGSASPPSKPAAGASKNASAKT